MKIWKQMFVVLAVGIFIVPQIALAVWWNPLSWSIWNIFKSAPTSQVQVATTTPIVPSTAAGKKADTSTKDGGQKNSSTKKVDQPKTEVPKTSIVTLPSGAVVEMDTNGNILHTITEAPQQTYTPPATPAIDTAAQDRQNQINSITTSCNLQINQISQQIIDLESAYYKQVAVIQKQPIPIGDINGQVNNLTNSTIQKIDQLNLQIDQVRLDCQNKIYQLQ